MLLLLCLGIALTLSFCLRHAAVDEERVASLVHQVHYVVLLLAVVGDHLQIVMHLQWLVPVLFLSRVLSARVQIFAPQHLVRRIVLVSSQPIGDKLGPLALTHDDDRGALVLINALVYPGVVHEHGQIHALVILGRLL